MNTDILQASKRLQKELVAHRRYLHQYPELGFQLPVTTAYIFGQLKTLGYTPTVLAHGGIAALAGDPALGKCVLIRGDMDALPLEEQTDVPFRSKHPGCMHACGHDAHMAILLGVAKLLKQEEPRLPGAVKLVFQPAEETANGGQSLVDDGVLEDPHVDCAIGLHVSSTVKGPAGVMKVPCSGVALASMDQYRITVTGKGCHGGKPHLGVDPINVIAHIHTALQEILSREIPADETVVLTQGMIYGGSTGNVIPQTAVLEGSLRTFNEEIRQNVKARICEITEYISRAFRACGTVDFLGGCPVLSNDPYITGLMRTYLGQLLGEDYLLIGTQPSSTSDDFSCILSRVPGCYCFLSLRPEKEEDVYPMHHPQLKLNEDKLYVGTAALTYAALRLLAEHPEAPEA